MTAIEFTYKIKLRLPDRAMKMAKKLFLSDEPITKLEEDKFGHEAFVSTLYECVRKCDAGINIGLFGKWGVGKTSIIYRLFERFKSKTNSDKKVGCFFFDAWRYPGESLRQEVILKLNKMWKIFEEKELEDYIYNVEEVEKPIPKESLKDRFIHPWKYIRWDRFGFSVIIFAVLLVILLPLHFFDVVSITSSVSLFLLPVLVQLIKELSFAGSSLGRRIILPSKLDPERLGTKFSELVDEIIKRNKIDILVVAIDNLDRCASQSAIEMLEAIKTFMGHKQCVYLFPCDHAALVKHLRLSRQYTEEEANEFLRKFFQASFTIPSFLPQDLERFIGENLSQLIIKYSPGVFEIITSAYGENPRRIKQFINNLTTQYIAAQEREKAGIVEDGRITGNDAFLAKLLVIRERWPSFYEKLESDEGLLAAVESYLRGIGEIPKYSDENIFEANPGIEQFLVSTRLISDEEVSPFLRLNKEIVTSEFEELKRRFNLGDVDYVISNLDELEAEEKVIRIKEMLEILDKEILARRFEFAFNGLNILTHIYHQISDEIKSEVAEKIGVHMTRKELLEHLDKLKYAKVFPVLHDVREEYRNDILYKYSLLLSAEEIDQDLIDQFIENNDIVPDKVVENLNTALGNAWESNREEALVTIRKLNQKPEASERLISESLVTKIEESAATTVTDENKVVIDLYLELKGRAVAQTKLSFLRKILSVIYTNRDPAYDETKQYGLQVLMGLDLKDIPDDGVGELSNTLNELTGLVNLPGKLEFIRAFFKFSDVFSQQGRGEFLKSYIVPLADSGDVNIVRNILDMAKTFDAKILTYDFVLDAFTNRVQSNLPDVELVKSITLNTPKENREKVKGMLVGLINNDDPHYHNAGLEGFRQLYVEFTANPMGEICDTCLDRSKSVATPEKRKFIDPILEAFEKCPARFKSKFADHTLEFIRNDDTEIRDMGIECFRKIENLIDENKKREIIIQLLHTITQRATQDKINESCKPLLDLIVENQTIIGENDTVSFIDTLTGLLSEAKPKEVHLIGLEYLGRIRELYYRRDLVLREVEEDLQSEDEDIIEQAKQTLELLRASKKESGKTSKKEPNSSKEA